MDPLVITMAVVAIMVTPTVMVMDSDFLPSLQRKLQRELLVAVVVIVMATTTSVTISNIASLPTPQRIAVHWSAATDPLVLAAIICKTTVIFLYQPPRGIPKNMLIETVIRILFRAAVNTALHFIIAIAMHIAVYVWLSCVYMAGGLPIAITMIIRMIMAIPLYIGLFSIHTTKRLVAVTATTIDATVSIAATNNMSKEMAAVVGAIVLWIIAIVIARIRSPKVEEVPATYKSGTRGYPPLAQNTDFGINVAACERLAKHAFAPFELAFLIETVFSSEAEGNIVRSLHGDDAQAFIDVIDKALDELNLTPCTRKKCLKSLYKICGRCAILPKALRIPLCYNRDDFPLYQGGFADVWKGSYQGQDVAVKVLRVYQTSDLDKIRGVSHWLSDPPVLRT